MSNNIVKHSQLHDIAGDLWTKAKKRDIERFEYDSDTKTLKGKNSTDTALSINVKLTDLVSINDRAKFKQDVSVDSAANINNLHIGTLNGAHNQNRFSGCRAMTSKSFVDGYVNHLLVLVDDALNVNAPTSWRIWAVKKGATRNADVIFKAYHTNALVQSTVQQYTIKNQTVKCAKIAIDEEFRDEVYFIVQCDGQPVRVMNNLPTDHTQDVVNLSKAPDNTPNSTIDWDQYNANQNMVALCLVGRESIASLAEKIKQTQADGSKYVLQSETTATGGAGSANKVARLDNNGKLHADMLPSIAINDYIPASAFTHDALRQLEFQNGDIIVVTANGRVTRYLCVDKAGHQNNLTEAFIPLNDKEGIVFSVNEQRPGTDGNVTVTAEHIKIAASSTTNVKQELDKKISNITLKTGDNKKLTVTKADGQTSDVDLTEAFKASNVTYGKPIAGTAKATVDAALDALNEEVNKGIKTIKGGRPGTNGDMNVTVAESGTTGITMTFGTTGGTPVQIATYMTTDEVNQIKALFV